MVGDPNVVAGPILELGCWGVLRESSAEGPDRGSYLRDPGLFFFFYSSLSIKYLKR